MKIEKNYISDLLQLFATHEIAVLLKKMGFNEHCFAYYDEKKELIFQDKPYAFWTKNDKINWNRNMFRLAGKENVCAAPTWEQVVDFLNENTDYIMTLDADKLRFENYDIHYSFIYHDKFYKILDRIHCKSKFDTYEKGILTVLNLILNNKKA